MQRRPRVRVGDHQSAGAMDPAASSVSRRKRHRTRPIPGGRRLPDPIRIQVQGNERDPLGLEHVGEALTAASVAADDHVLSACAIERVATICSCSERCIHCLARHPQGNPPGLADQERADQYRQQHGRQHRLHGGVVQQPALHRQDQQHEGELARLREPDTGLTPVATPPPVARPGRRQSRTSTAPAAPAG